MKLDIPFHDEVCEFTKTENKTSLDLKVESRYGKILLKFKIFYYDWEMDNYGYVVNDGARNKLVTTNHGRLTEIDVDYLFHKIKEYENAIRETKEAIKIFENGIDKV